MGASGSTTINFGAFPGGMDTTAVITGQAGIVGGSLVEAWLVPLATADHTADEHWVETIAIVAGNIVAGTGFTIYAQSDAQVIPLNQAINCGPDQSPLPPGHRLYGLWSVSWCWN
jgi:hypothetical protein